MTPPDDAHEPHHAHPTAAPDPVDPLVPGRLTRLPSWLGSQMSLEAHRLIGAQLAEEGLRRAHFAVLAALDEQGATSQAELGRRLWIDRSDLHAVLNDLEREGLVARERDPADRRRNAVVLTNAGSEALDRLDALVAEAHEQLLAPLSDAERDELRRLLSIVVGHHAAQARERAGDAPPASRD